MHAVSPSLVRCFDALTQCDGASFLLHNDISFIARDGAFTQRAMTFLSCVQWHLFLVCDETFFLVHDGASFLMATSPLYHA
jgi:hypothetical protein